MHDQSERHVRHSLPEGLLAALIGAALIFGAFVGFTAALPLSPAERWAALMMMAVLASAVTLPGCGAVADGLGRVVRRDWRAYATLLAAFPMLFLAYAAAVRAVRFSDLLSVMLLVFVPGYVLWRNRGARRPTPLDAVGLGGLWLAGALGLWPMLALPVVGGRTDFFTLAVVPLVVVLLAARGWPGLGLSWHLSGADLRTALIGALIGLALTLPARLTAEAVGSLGGWAALGRAIETYFFIALPIAILDRGVVQQGVMQALARWEQLGPLIGIAVGALLAGGRVLALTPNGISAAVTAALAAIGYGWVYWRTGKVTAAAVSQMLVGIAGVEAPVDAVALPGR